LHQIVAKEEEDEAVAKEEGDEAAAAVSVYEPDL
jgi:hypothetical protein